METLQGVEVHCVKTGVKNLHERAESLSIGVYFEANGHGTVLFSPAFSASLAQALADEGSGDLKIKLDWWGGGG